jgi:hypothetical protein
MVGLLLNSCAGITVTDSMWCGSLASQGAYCSHTLTNATETMTLAQFAAYWDDLSDPKVATSVSTLAEWKADIEKLCTFSNACSAQVQAQVTAVYNKISAAHATAKKVVK